MNRSNNGRINDKSKTNVCIVNSFFPLEMEFGRPLCRFVRGQIESPEHGSVQIVLCILRPLSSFCSFLEQNFLFKISVIFVRVRRPGIAYFIGKKKVFYFLGV